jgi:hypothetical protein
MEASAITSGDGTILAPDHFTLLLHPADFNGLRENPELLLEMGELIFMAGKSAGYQFGQHPVVMIAPNSDVQQDQIEIVTRISDKALGHTANLVKPAPNNPNDIPVKAFLIVNGKEEFALNQTVINIGRQSGNQLRLNDSRVSRKHAQIRARYGRYEIFDLDSTGGTYINNKRIKRSHLRPGDVISLAGVNLIYGQESISGLIDTKELTPSQSRANPNPLDQGL